MEEKRPPEMYTYVRGRGWVRDLAPAGKFVPVQAHGRPETWGPSGLRENFGLYASAVHSTHYRTTRAQPGPFLLTGWRVVGDVAVAVVLVLPDLTEVDLPLVPA